MTALEVACATDERYLPHCAAMIASLLDRQGPCDLRIHVLHAEGLRRRPLQRLASWLAGTRAELVTHPIKSAQIQGLPAWGRIPATMWYRILLPELMPDSSRVLYVDVDVLFCEPLTALWEVDLGEYYVGAVTNLPERHMLDHAERLGLGGADQYFNSGVLLMNLDLMRLDHCTGALRRCALERAGHLLWPDQDVLNLVLGHRRRALDPRWNAMNSLRLFAWRTALFSQDQIAAALDTPAIVHFEGPSENKPWHVLCQHPSRDAYRSYRHQTPWPRIRPQGVTPGNVLRLAAGFAARGRLAVRP